MSKIDQRYGPASPRVRAFVRALRDLGPAQWSAVQERARAATWKLATEGLMQALTESGLRDASMTAFDDAAYATRVALLGPTDLTPSEVVQWTLEGWPLFSDREEGEIFEEQAAKEAANAAGFASNALVAGDGLASADFDNLYGPFAIAIPVDGREPIAASPEGANQPALAGPLRAKPGARVRYPQIPKTAGEADREALVSHLKQPMTAEEVAGSWNYVKVAPGPILPDYVRDRLRRPPPAGSGVVPLSTPVTAFGRLSQAVVATLGLNPSKAEFQDARGALLPEPLRRFETLPSLGVVNLQDASDEVLTSVVSTSEGYFDRNPYRRWFNQLEGILDAVGTSYYRGTACHLDVAQWSTDPVWRDLDDDAKERLLDDGIPFLAEELERSAIQVLLINGSGVSTIFRRRMTVDLEEAGPPVADGRITNQFLTGRVGKVQVIAWSTNLQSTPGVTNRLRDLTRDRVVELAAAK